MLSLLRSGRINEGIGMFPFGRHRQVKLIPFMGRKKLFSRERKVKL